MKKLLILLLLFSCTKENPRISDEVLLTVTSECSCSIKVLQTDGRQYLSTRFDCEYIHILPMHIVKGIYTIQATNGQGKQVNQVLIKGNYSQEVNIEF